MKCKVISAYTDRITKKVHMSGEEVELPDERADELAGRGFVEKPAEEPEKPAPKKAASRSKSAGGSK